MRFWQVFAYVAFIIVSIFTLTTSASSLSSAPQQELRTARIGVLAYLGIDAANRHWQPLANYLTQKVDGWQFKLVPFNLVSAPQQIEDMHLQFVITNPGHFVDLADRFGMSALATREALVPNSSKQLQKFGIAIVVRNDSDIRNMSELKARSIAAVNRDAFGGFQIGWHELKEHGVDIFRDLDSIRYMGFPMDALLTAVVDGEVDASILRSGLLEASVDDGLLSRRDVRVLNSNQRSDFPYAITGRLYPEWPFATLPNVPKKLREMVLVSLLETQNEQTAKQFALTDIWTPPLYYGEVRQLVQSYRARLSEQNRPYWNAHFFWPAVAFFSTLLFIVTLLFLAFGGMNSAGRKRTVSGSKIDGAVQKFLPKFETLTRRERQILGLICRGLSTKIIAYELGISPKTVEFHRTNLLQKTGAGTTAHLVQIATRLELDQGYSLG